MAIISVPAAVATAAAANGTLAELVNVCKKGLHMYRENCTPSLTAYTKITNIMSRMYVEDNILRDDICPSLVGVLNQLYVSYVLSALNLDTLCANGRTVRQMIETVGTENYDVVDEIMKTFGSNNYNYSNEASPLVDLEPATQRLPCGRLIELSMTGAVPLNEVSTKNEKDYDKDGNKTGSSSTQTKTTSASTYQFKAYLYVQLIPYVLQSNVVDGYISANFNPPLKSRWQKLRAGEISFWNDFVFTRDLIKKQEKVLKDDKSGVILDMMLKNRSKLGHWFLSLFALKPVSHNIANSILITNKETFVRACNESGIKFDNYEQRQRYFNKTWSMIICVVDPMYNTIDMYFNGLDCKGTYTFDIINRVGAKGKDSFDLKEIMGAFSQGLTPKF